MLLTPRKRERPTAKKQSTTTPQPKYAFSIRLDFQELAPPVLSALRGLDPSIDASKVVNAIRSELGSQRATITWAPTTRGTSTAFRKAIQTLLKPVSQTVGGQFFKWHQQVSAQSTRNLSATLDIPPEFHAWLHNPGLRSDRNECRSPKDTQAFKIKTPTNE